MNARAAARQAAILSLFCFCLSGSALAALGEGEASIALDQAQMKATRRVVAASQYTVHEIQTSAGTMVREYVSLDGLVFAVSWKGPLMPDLQQVLGGYFAAYRAAGRSQLVRRGSLRLQQPGLVVHSGGRMRAFSGLAYLPQQLPANVTADELQ